jgi:murein DD-endopeptidase MepM/ murein hydrolase activator NlpD
MHRARIIATVSVLALALTVTPLGLPISGLPGSPAAASATRSDEVEYRLPSDAPIVDRFRPPVHRWEPGNRGIDFGTTDGATVRAAADGRVVFAGEVGGALHVTVEHADRLRTTYSFLASTLLSRGDRIVRGDHIGTAAGPFHFGVRTPDGTYLDPELVLPGRCCHEFCWSPEPMRGRTRSMPVNAALCSRRSARVVPPPSPISLAPVEMSRG